MSAFTLGDLQEIARDIIGDDDIFLAPEMCAQDVPGWDSLSHTIISVEIAARTGHEMDAQVLAQFDNFGDMVGYVNKIIGDREPGRKCPGSF